jgi:Ca-activated chloride channel homolog
MRFELPILLALAPVIGLLITGMAWLAQRRRIRLATAWSPGLGQLARRGAALSLPLLGGAALVAALGTAGPRGGPVERVAAARGLNVMLAVDVSRSMLAEDADPNRLDRAVREARRLVQDLRTDRIGVIGFAGQSYVLAPLTLDHGAVGLYLETLDPDLASAQGTHFEAVLRQGLQVLESSREGGDRALVVFTDGEAHDSLPAAVTAARDVGRAGIRLILVAQGGILPVRIPLRDATGRITEYKRDADGEIVETRRRDDVLQQVAAAAGGVVIAAEVPDQAGAIRDELQSLGRRPVRERRLADLTPLAWVTALVAALLLAAQTGTRRGAALASLLLLLGAHAASAQRPSPGESLYRTGRAEAAGAAFRAEAERAASDTAWYNAGTAALAAGRFPEATEALQRAARSLDPGLRFRALYNLGLTAFSAARADTAGRAARVAEATEHFKQALLLEPASREAKWNLELVLQETPPPQSGGGAQGPRGGGGGPAPPEPSGGLSPTEAEAILQSVERNEATTRANAVRRQRLRTASSLRDW